MTTIYQIDPAHSTAHFTVRHMMITNVHGSFAGVRGTIMLDPNDLQSSQVEAVIDATTIKTGDDQRDAHLKSADFLNTEQFPTMAFKSSKVEPAGDGEWKVTGSLSLHGVSREVVLQVEGPTSENKDPFGNTRIGASARTKIKRSDFGLQWNVALETGGIMVGDELKIEIEISAIRAEAQKAA